MFVSFLLNRVYLCMIKKEKLFGKKTHEELFIERENLIVTWDCGNMHITRLIDKLLKKVHKVSSLIRFFIYGKCGFHLSISMVFLTSSIFHEWSLFPNLFFINYWKKGLLQKWVTSNNSIRRQRKHKSCVCFCVCMKNKNILLRFRWVVNKKEMVSVNSSRWNSFIKIELALKVLSCTSYLKLTLLSLVYYTNTTNIIVCLSIIIGYAVKNVFVFIHDWHSPKGTTGWKL